MQGFWKKLYWKIYFFLRGKPTAAQVEAKIASLIAARNKEMTTQQAGQNCDCAVYNSLGEFIACHPNIPKYACDGLVEPGIEAAPLAVGECARLRH